MADEQVDWESVEGAIAQVISDNNEKEELTPDEQLRATAIGLGVQWVLTLKQLQLQASGPTSQDLPIMADFPQRAATVADCFYEYMKTGKVGK